MEHHLVRVWLTAYSQLISFAGHFAVKKIAVGDSQSYLLKILREVCDVPKSDSISLMNM